MSMLRFLIGSAVALILAGCVMAEPRSEPPLRAPSLAELPRGAGRLVPVIEVENVSMRLLESYPEQIHITARGQANSVARDGQLRLRGVRNGIYEFDFLARLPRGPVTMMMGPITAHHSMTRPRGLRGVRIHAKSNSISDALHKEKQ